MLTRILCLSLLAPVALVAPQDAVAELATRLRNPKLTLDERIALEEKMLSFGENGARTLQKIVEERISRTDEHVKKTEKAYLADFEKAARKLVEGRLDKAALAEIETARKVVLDLSKDAALSKERIHNEGDPAREKLSKLLFVQLDQILEAKPELAATRDTLSNELFDIEQDHALWQRCNWGIPEKKRGKPLADPVNRWPELEQAEAWACLMATPMSDGDRDVFAKNRAMAPELAEPEEAAGILDLNRLRVLLGLNALLCDVKLCAAARDHSNDMRTLGFFAHESPVPGKKTPWDRAARFGTSAGAENIAAGQQTGADANLAWWYSPGHHKNMLGSHSRVALGRSEHLWTQMFG